MFLLDVLRFVGFSQVALLHKNICFAAFIAVKLDFARSCKRLRFYPAALALTMPKVSNSRGIRIVGVVRNSPAQNRLPDSCCRPEVGVTGGNDSQVWRQNEVQPRYCLKENSKI